jgi:hypothetical protein
VYYHRRFCHANPQTLALLHTVCDIKKIVIPEQIPLCETCARQKIHKRQSKKLAAHKQELLALFSFDVAGPFHTSFRGYRYFGEVVDNWSRKTWTLLFRDRTEIKAALNKWKKKVELRTGKRVMAARTDNAPEILETLNEWGNEHGIAVQTTETHTSAQNGPAERSIQYTEHNVRSMLDDAELPVEFWCEAAEAQSYVRARMRKGPVVVEEVIDEISGKPFRVEYRISPEEAYTGKPPKVHGHIRTWGCKVIAHVSRASLPGRQDKYMPSGREGIFMGYDENTTAHYRVYAPDMHTTVISSNVTFFEDLPGSSIDNYQLWVEASDGTFEQADGTYNKHVIRRKRGRPLGWRKDRSHLLSPTVDSIRKEQARKLPDVAIGTATPNVADPEPETPLPDTHDAEAETIFQSPAFSSKPELKASQSPAQPCQVRTPEVILGEEDTSTKPMGGKRARDEEEHPATTRKTRTVERTYSEEDRPLKKYYGKKADDPKQWELPHSREEAAESRIPDFGQRVLRSGTKRAREEALSEEDADAKRVKSMLAMLEWFSEDVEDPAEEAAMIASAATHNIPIPTSYKEAVNDPDYGKQWKAAIDFEIGQLLANNTWEEKPPPPGVNLISSKWVFTLKFLPDGSLERFKARLVARGFTQQYGIDYTETFAPTVRMATLRAFFAVVACEDLECRQYDIKNAFTESNLDEDLWMKVPQGISSRGSGTALHLLRSLYGLKQAARDWNLLMKAELTKWGFHQSKADPCLFVHPERGIRLLVYVDDLAAAAPKNADLDWFYKKLDARFNAKELGEIQKILGVGVTRNRGMGTVELDQEQYLEKVLTKFGFPHAVHKASNISTPIDGYNDLRPATQKDRRVDATWYREVIGSVMYAMIYTRPDIAFALGRLSQYMQDPAEHHASALKRLLRYLRSTIKSRISFGPSGNLVVYSDADYATDKTDRKSISASVGLIGGGPVFWGSKKQTAVATATTEAEYIAMSSTAKQGQWVAQILRDMGYGGYVASNHQTVDTRGDNQGAIALSKNPHLTERSKHIDIAYHYIRDLHERGRASVSYVPTDAMAADGLSKPLPKSTFQRFMNQIGMVLKGQGTGDKGESSS